MSKLLFCIYYYIDDVNELNYSTSGYYSYKDVKKISCSTYFLEDIKPYTFRLNVSDLKRKAKPEEIEEFESTIAANKYNL